MKKQLLTTTALVAAGVLTVSGAAHAQKPTLSLGGAMEQVFGVADNSDAFENRTATTAVVGFDQKSDTEVHFNGSVTLDNGIKIRTRVELEGGGLDGDTIDENWMRISGSFGEVRLGSTDGAAQAMTTGYMGTYSTGVGQNVGFDTRQWVPAGSGVTGASTIHRVDLTSDGEQIGYYTPRFAGFQLGVSYHPSRNEDVDTLELTSADDTDGWSLGANYVAKFSGVGVGIAVGYNEMDESTSGRSDPSVWGIAGRVDFAGFRVAASWIDQDSQETTSTGVTATPGVESLELGVRYSFGPNAVSASYLSAEAQSNVANSGDESEVLILAYRRTLGPGVTFSLSAIFADFDDAAAGADSSTSNDGQALVSSVKVSF